MSDTGQKLVFVWDNLGPTHADRLDALARLGTGKVRVVAIELSEKSETYAWDTIGVHGCERTTLFRVREKVSAIRKTARLLNACRKAGRAEFFFCNYEKIWVFLTALVLRLTGRNVFVMNDSKFDDYPRQIWREVLKRLFYLPYRGGLAAGHRSRDYMRFLGVPADRIALGYDSLSVDRIAASANIGSGNEIDFGDRHFIVVARLVPKKNLVMVLEAHAQHLRQASVPRDLHICGSGVLEAVLRSRVDALGTTGRVHFHGFLQTGSVGKMLGSSLCLLLPSIEEQFGLVVIEAQAAGLPVIVSENVGARDTLVRSGVNGFVVESDNPEGWAFFMTSLADNEDLWRRQTDAVRRTARRGDVSQFVEGVFHLIGRAGEK